MKGPILNRLTISLLLIVFLGFNGCNPFEPYDAGSYQNIEENPVPRIVSISRNRAIAHGPAFTLTIKGDHFRKSSVIVFNEEEKNTTYHSVNHLSCEFSPDDTVLDPELIWDPPLDGTAGTLETKIRVRNPAPGGGDSEIMKFTIYHHQPFTLPFFLGPGSSSDLALDQSKNPQVVFEGEMIQTDTPNTWGNYIYFRSSDNGGFSWNPPAKIVKSKTGKKSDPAINVNRYNYIECIYGKGRSILHSRSLSKGKSWSVPDSMFTDAYHHPIDFRELSLQTDQEGNLAAVFSYNGSAPTEFYHSFTYQSIWGNWGLTTYSSNVRTYHPSLALDSKDNVHWTYIRMEPFNNISFDNQLIFYQKSNNRGRNATRRNISTQPGIFTGSAIDTNQQGNVFVIYHWRSNHSDTSAVYYLHSQNKGETWTRHKKISKDYHHPFIDTCDLAVDDAGNINTVWTGNSRIYFSRSMDQGENWTTPVVLSGGQINPQKPKIEVDSDGFLYLTWFNQDSDGQKGVYFCRSGK